MAEKTTAKVKPPIRSGIPPNTVFIGQKPIMTYVTAIVMHFNSGSKELTVKARGRVISQAVDVVEVCRRRGNVTSPFGDSLGHKRKFYKIDDEVAEECGSNGI